MTSANNFEHFSRLQRDCIAGATVELGHGVDAPNFPENQPSNTPRLTISLIPLSINNLRKRQSSGDGGNP